MHGPTWDTSIKKIFFLANIKKRKICEYMDASIKKIAHNYKKISSKL